MEHFMVFNKTREVFLMIFMFPLMVQPYNDLINLECPPLSNFVDCYTKFFICERVNRTVTTCNQVTIPNLNTYYLKPKPLVVIVGDMYDETLPSEDLLVQAYSKRGNENVVYIQHLLTFWKIQCPFLYAEIIGETLIIFIQKIYTINDAITPSITHLIGNGMGAIVAGYAALNIPHIMFNRVTGLDPTLYFSNVPLRSAVYPLRPTVSEFTDIYHTNTGMIGVFQLRGDVDVFFNNDVHMPGCKGDNLCSHKKAVHYYVQTILEKELYGIPCYFGLDLLKSVNNNFCRICSNRNDSTLVGENMAFGTRGSYKVITRGFDGSIFDDKKL